MNSPEDSASHLRPKTRRPHAKTKTGCLDCRKRRVKCTEEKPKCRACLRRDIPCEYPQQPRTPATSVADLVAHDGSFISAGQPYSEPQHNQAWSFTSSPLLSIATPATESSTTSAPTSSITPSPDFTINDLALLHHWTMCTSVGIFQAPDIGTVWQVSFPQIGFQFPFVARIILSLAALHLAYIEGSGNSPHLLEAARHHNEALQGFQAAVSNITDENSEALFIWSILNVLYVFGLSKPRGPDVQDNTFRGIHKDRVLGMEWIPMMRGIDAVLIPTHNFIRFSRLKGLMGTNNFMELDPNHVHVSPESPDHDFCRTRESWNNNNPDAATYEKALHILRKCHFFMEQFKDMDDATLAKCDFNRAWAGPFMFIHFAPEEYFTLLHQRQPPALILYAYFGALLHTLNEYWFLEGWGKAVIELVNELIGGYWRPWIGWPLKVVGMA